jgi:hypothetical protein
MKEESVWFKRLRARRGGLLVIALLTASCGRAQGEKVYPVEGKVLFHRQPAVGAIVRFQPELSKLRHGLAPVQPVGIVGEDGSFSLTSFGKDDGAPPGEYVVTITWPDRSQRPVAIGIKPKKGHHADRLQGRYSSAKTPIRAEVKAGNNSLPPYEIH